MHRSNDLAHLAFFYVALKAKRTVFTLIPHKDRHFDKEVHFILQACILKRLGTCMYICDPLGENPAKVIFFVILCFLQKNIFHMVKNII